jgi:hypothetical protein
LPLLVSQNGHGMGCASAVVLKSARKINKAKMATTTMEDLDFREMVAACCWPG